MKRLVMAALLAAALLASCGGGDGEEEGSSNGRTETPSQPEGSTSTAAPSEPTARGVLTPSEPFVARTIFAEAGDMIYSAYEDAGGNSEELYNGLWFGLAVRTEDVSEIEVYFDGPIPSETVEGEAWPSFGPPQGLELISQHTSDCAPWIAPISAEYVVVVGLLPEDQDTVFEADITVELRESPITWDGTGGSVSLNDALNEIDIHDIPEAPDCTLLAPLPWD